MSNVSGASADFDFWEFVNCSICHLEFVKESGALSSLPFWLTECGHVICNSHLQADQSCAACGSPGIQLMPLQRELEPPMSNWFNSVPGAFDAVAYSLRFQMNAMADLVRYFKKKYQQYRPLYERLQSEHAESKRLRKLVEELRQENKQLKQRLRMGDSDTSDRINANGKRARRDDDGYMSGQRTSSPRSTATPLGPDRLTLPPGQYQPHFNTRQSLQVQSTAPAKQSLGHYAYVPPRSAQAQTMAMPALSHAQSSSARRAQNREEADTENMPPPLIPATRPERQASVDPRAQMPPPSTPQLASGSRLLPPRPSFLPGTPHIPASNGSQRFVPQTPGKTSATAIMQQSTTHIGTSSEPRSHYAQQQQQQQSPQTQRFTLSAGAQRLPAMASAHSSGSLAGSISGSIGQTHARTGSMAPSGVAGQRTPFVPSTGGGFS
ncbi:hypothetical protein OH77DRAFT_1416257 [Trametes cingulata]|nr:hypothetical protein OH77DRAFT_1416257 [Trametes cingulata]